MHPAPLEYRTPRSSDPAIGLYWFSVIMSIVVAIGGTACLLGYWRTQSQVFLNAGLGWLAIGGAGFVAALVCASMYLTSAKRAAVARCEAIRRGNRAVFLALSNLPLAAVCMLAGAYLVFFPATTFAIRNIAATPVVRGEIEIGRKLLRFRGIAPGQTRRLRVRAGDGGEVSLRVFNESGAPTRFILADHADSDDLGNRTVTIELDGLSEPKTRW